MCYSVGVMATITTTAPGTTRDPNTGNRLCTLVIPEDTMEALYKALSLQGRRRLPLHDLIAAHLDDVITDSTWRRSVEEARDNVDKAVAALLLVMEQ